MRSWQAQLKDKFNLEATPWGSGTTMAITQFADTYDEDVYKRQGKSFF